MGKHCLKVKHFKWNPSVKHWKSFCLTIAHRSYIFAFFPYICKQLCRIKSKAFLNEKIFLVIYLLITGMIKFWFLIKESKFDSCVWNVSQVKLINCFLA